MVSISVAGFGGEISLQEVLLLFQLLFLALCVVNVALAPAGTNVLVAFDERVIGYPVCHSFFCVAPSKASIDTISTSFSTNFANTTDISAFFNLVFSGFDIIKGLIGLLIALSVLLAGVQALYGYYYFLGVFQKD